MSLKPFTVVIVSIALDGSPAYSTVFVQATSVDQILHTKEVRDLLDDPDTAEIAAVFHGHHMSISSAAYSAEGNADVVETSHISMPDEKIDVWHIESDIGEKQIFISPPEFAKNVEHKGSLNFQYIFDTYDNFAELEVDEPDIAETLISLLDYMKESDTYSMLVTQTLLSRIVTNPDLPFDTIVSTMEATDEERFTSTQEDYFSDVEPDKSEVYRDPSFMPQYREDDGYYTGHEMY